MLAQLSRKTISGTVGEHMKEWSEERLRDYFENGGGERNLGGVVFADRKRLKSDTHAPLLLQGCVVVARSRHSAVQLQNLPEAERRLSEIRSVRGSKGAGLRGCCAALAS